MSAVSKQLRSPHFWLFAVFVSLLYATISIFVFPGYKTEKDDQRYYLPSIRQYLDNELYQRDFLMSAPQADASLFDELIGFMAFGNQENVFPVLFWMMLVTQTMFFLGCILITLACTRKTNVALLLPLAFIIGYHGIVTNAMPLNDWLFSYDAELHPRSVAIALSVLALGLFFLEFHGLSWLLVSAGFLIHPITVIPVIIFFGLYSLGTEIIQKKNLLYAGWYLLPILALLLLKTIMHESAMAGIDLFTRLDPVWTNFSKDWTPWVFFSDQFNQTRIIGIYLPLLLFFLISTVSTLLPIRAASRLIIFFGTAVILTIFGVIFFDNFGFSFPGQLQFHRSIHLLSLLIAIAALATCVFEICRIEVGKWHKIVFAAVFVFLIMGGNSLYLPLSLALFLTGFFLIAAPFFRKQHYLVLVYVVLSAIILLKAIFHPLSAAQGRFFFTWIGQIMSDPVSAFGLFLMWLLPVTAAVILLISLISVWKSKPLSGRNYAVLSSATIMITVVIFGFNWAQLPTLVTPESTKSTEITEWASNTIDDADLVFASDHSEEIGLFLRNHLDKSIFVTTFGQSQGTFNRAYALEWIKRQELRKDPLLHLAELEAYGIDYYIFAKQEALPPLPVAYESASIVVFRSVH